MAQAYASATRASIAITHKAAPVVQSSLQSLYCSCTTFSPPTLLDAMTNSLITELEERGGRPLDQDVAKALSELVATMVAMADGTAPPNFHLSCLDPGLGKTTALIHFVQKLMGSEQHDGVAVLLCFAQREEIVRLVAEMGLVEADFAILTSDCAVNQLSSTPLSEARVLFTTHAMIESRCRGRSFEEAEVFHYRGEARAVRIWDEAMLPSNAISINTDQLAALREPLRVAHTALAQMVEKLEMDIRELGGGGTYIWPTIEEVTGVSPWSARRGLEPRHAAYLDSLYDLSGRRVLLRKTHNASEVITALDSRDAIPDDLAPVLILDASGRVRSTYSQWEKRKGNLVRLPSAVRNYGNLTVRVMDRGSGRTAWRNDGGVLALEVAKLINSKPDEEWLVIYQKGANGGKVPDQIQVLLSSNPGRVHFLNWGKHHGTNEFRHVQNVILAGMNNYSETDYEMMARYYSGIPNDQDVPTALVAQMQAGEHQHHILQALCRSSVRQGIGSECGPCSAYIIAPTRSGVRKLLPKMFPGCKVGTWRPTAKRPKGNVQKALAYLEAHFENHPDGVMLFTELRAVLGYDASNFRSRIRKHISFIEGLSEFGIEEVFSGNGRFRNAFAKKTSAFGPVEGAS